MKKIMLSTIIASMSIASIAQADPTIYGNLNLNLNKEENPNGFYEDTGEYYVGSYGSNIGLSGSQNVRNNNYINQVRYQIEFDLNLLNENNPLSLNDAHVNIRMPLLNVKVGKQNTIQNDLLLRSMDVFNTPRIIAAEERGGVSKKSNLNNIRIEGEFAGNFIGGSVSLNKNDREEYSFGVARRGQSHRLGFVYWTDESTDETLSYYGINGTYRYGAWALSGTYIYPNNSNLSNSYDVALAGRISETVRLKSKYGSLIDEWSMYGFGAEGELSSSAIWYAEYQSKTYDDNAQEKEFIYSVGINYEF